MNNEWIELLGMGFLWLVMIFGLIGIIVPLLPGILLIWLAVLAYAVFDGFTLISVPTFALISVIALVTGTADLWLPLLGAKTTGVPWKTIALGVVGGIAGTFLLPILGTILGYAAGILLGEYLRLGLLRPALKSSLIGLASWGVGTAIQLAGGILIIIIFARAIME